MNEDFDPLDEAFDYAERRDNLVDVPEWAKEAYTPLEGGGYELRSPRIKDMFRQSREQIVAHKKQIADLDAEIAAANAKEQANMKRLHELIAGQAIRASLEAGGCLPKFIAGATAILLRELPVKLEDIDGELVPVLEGGGSIDHAVKSYLFTEEGSAFCAPRPLPGSGMFAEGLRELLH